MNSQRKKRKIFQTNEVSSEASDRGIQVPQSSAGVRVRAPEASKERPDQREAELVRKAQLLMQREEGLIRRLKSLRFHQVQVKDSGCQTLENNESSFKKQQLFRCQNSELEYALAELSIDLSNKDKALALKEQGLRSEEARLEQISHQLKEKQILLELRAKEDRLDPLGRLPDIQTLQQMLKNDLDSARKELLNYSSQSFGVDFELDIIRKLQSKYVAGINELYSMRRQVVSELSSLQKMLVDQSQYQTRMKQLQKYQQYLDQTKASIQQKHELLQSHKQKYFTLMKGLRKFVKNWQNPFDLDSKTNRQLEIVFKEFDSEEARHPPLLFPEHQSQAPSVEQSGIKTKNEPKRTVNLENDSRQETKAFIKCKQQSKREDLTTLDATIREMNKKKVVIKVLRMWLGHSRHNSKQGTYLKQIAFLRWKMQAKINGFSEQYRYCGQRYTDQFQTHWCKQIKRQQRQMGFKYSGCDQELRPMAAQLLLLEKKYFHKQKQQFLLKNLIRNKTRRQRIIFAAYFLKFKSIAPPLLRDKTSKQSNKYTEKTTKPLSSSKAKDKKAEIQAPKRRPSAKDEVKYSSKHISVMKIAFLRLVQLLKQRDIYSRSFSKWKGKTMRLRAEDEKRLAEEAVRLWERDLADRHNRTALFLEKAAQQVARIQQYV